MKQMRQASLFPLYIPTRFYCHISVCVEYLMHILIIQHCTDVVYVNERTFVSTVTESLTQWEYLAHTISKVCFKPNWKG